MKSVLRITAAGLALATLGVASNASAATATANAQAEILSTLTLTLDTTDNTLDFGKIAPTSTLVANSTVAVSAANARTCGANLTCSGTTAVPLFHVTGLANSQVAVTLPAAAVQLQNFGTIPASMSNVMSLGTFTTDAGSPLALTGGSNTFHVGGTLTVKPNQAPGVYVGTFDVSVQYN